MQDNTADNTYVKIKSKKKEHEYLKGKEYYPKGLLYLGKFYYFFTSKTIKHSSVWSKYWYEGEMMQRRQDNML